MAQNFPDVEVKTDWVDILTLPGFEALAGQRVSVQAVSVPSTPIKVYLGGAAAPAGDWGNRLVLHASVTGTTDHIWVKGRGSVAVLLED